MITAPLSNLAMMKIVAFRLGPLRKRVAFLGGSATGLLILLFKFLSLSHRYWIVFAQGLGATKHRLTGGFAPSELEKSLPTEVDRGGGKERGSGAVGQPDFPLSIRMPVLHNNRTVRGPFGRNGSNA